MRLKHIGQMAHIHTPSLQNPLRNLEGNETLKRVLIAATNNGQGLTDPYMPKITYKRRIPATTRS